MRLLRPSEILIGSLQASIRFEKSTMTDSELKALTAQVKRLTSRVEALEKLLERIIRQKPVSERQLEKALRTAGLQRADLSR